MRIVQSRIHADRPAADETSATTRDPLLEYKLSLPPALLDPTVRVSFPVGNGFSSSYGSRTLEEFGVLKLRENAKTFGPDESEYSRYRTPITSRLEKQLADLDAGEAALVFSSGMAAIDTVIDAILPTQRGKIGHFIVAKEGYRQTTNILERMAERGWIELTQIPTVEFVHVAKFLQPNTSAIIFETPSNPYLRTIDVQNVRHQIDNAKSSALVIVDHTFSSPINQRPLEQGAHLVIPSLTKYVGGKNEAMGGVVIGDNALVDKISQFRGQKGNILSDDHALRFIDSLRTLEERMAIHNRNGQHVSEILERHPLVERVWYPGLPSHPDYEISKKQMSGYGGVVTFTIKANDLSDVAAFSNQLIRNLNGAFIAPSFGSDNALLSVVTVVSHFSQSSEERAARNIPFNLLRLSVGTGSEEALTAALRAGFDALDEKLLTT